MISSAWFAFVAAGALSGLLLVVVAVGGALVAGYARRELSHDSEGACAPGGARIIV